MKRAAREFTWLGRVFAWLRALVKTPDADAPNADLDDLGDLTRRRLLVVGDLLDADTRSLVRRLGVAEADVRRARRALSSAEADRDLGRLLDALRSDIDRTLSPAEGRLAAALALLPPRDGHALSQVANCVALMTGLSAASADACAAAARLGQLHTRWQSMEREFAPVISTYWRRAAVEGALLQRAAHVTSLAAADRLASDVAKLAESCERRRVSAGATAKDLAAAVTLLGGDPRAVHEATTDLGGRADMLRSELVRLAGELHDAHAPRVMQAAHKHVSYARSELAWAIEPVESGVGVGTIASRTLDRWADLRAFRIVSPPSGVAVPKPSDHAAASDETGAGADAAMPEAPNAALDTVHDAARGLGDAEAAPIDCPIRVEVSRRYGTVSRALITVRYMCGAPYEAQLVTPLSSVLHLVRAVEGIVAANDVACEVLQSGYPDKVAGVTLEAAWTSELPMLRISGVADSSLTLVGLQRAHFASALRRLA